MNFLIVDDHAGMRALIRDLVSDMMREGCGRIHECVNGEEALALCEKFVPDCVTMDLRMGGMTGISCVQRLRAQHPATNIAVVTQFDHPTLREHARVAGADAYVVKDDLTALRRFIELLADKLSDET